MEGFNRVMLQFFLDLYLAKLCQQCAKTVPFGVNKCFFICFQCDYLIHLDYHVWMSEKSHVRIIGCNLWPQHDYANQGEIGAAQQPAIVIPSLSDIDFFSLPLASHSETQGTLRRPAKRRKGWKYLHCKVVKVNMRQPEQSFAICCVNFYF